MLIFFSFLNSHLTCWPRTDCFLCLSFYFCVTKHLWIVRRDCCSQLNKTPRLQKKNEMCLIEKRITAETHFLNPFEVDLAVFFLLLPKNQLTVTPVPYRSFVRIPPEKQNRNRQIRIKNLSQENCNLSISRIAKSRKSFLSQ